MVRSSDYNLTELEWKAAEAMAKDNLSYVEAAGVAGYACPNDEAKRLKAKVEFNQAVIYLTQRVVKSLEGDYSKLEARWADLLNTAKKVGMRAMLTYLVSPKPQAGETTAALTAMKTVLDTVRQSGAAKLAEAAHGEDHADSLVEIANAIVGKPEAAREVAVFVDPQRGSEDTEH